jgi:hypothetical protein
LFPITYIFWFLFLNKFRNFQSNITSIFILLFFWYIMMRLKNDSRENEEGNENRLYSFFNMEKNNNKKLFFYNILKHNFLSIFWSFSTFFFRLKIFHFNLSIFFFVWAWIMRSVGWTIVFSCMRYWNISFVYVWRVFWCIDTSHMITLFGLSW